MRIESLDRVLRDHPFLRGLTEEQIRFVVGCAGIARFREGEYLIREGEPASTLYLVRRGRVALEINTPPRGILALETLEPGDILGVSWLFAPFRWSLDARAIGTVLAIGFDACCLREKMAADVAFGWAFSQRLLARLAERLHRVRLQRADLYRRE